MPFFAPGAFAPRAALLPAVAGPVSLAGTFWVMYLLGYSIDNLSLMAMTVATGFVVDDAIVVLENIDRHRHMGKSPFQAAYDGGREVWGAILASTLTTVAVFLPVVFLQIEVGMMFRDIAIAVTTAVLAIRSCPKPSSPTKRGCTAITTSVTAHVTPCDIR